MIQIRPETRAYRTPILRDMRPARTSTRIPFAHAKFSSPTPFNSLDHKSRLTWRRTMAAASNTGLPDRQRTLRGLLSRPAPLCEDQSPRISGATKLACQFKCFVAFRAWGHQAGELQGVCREVVPIKPVRQALCFLAHRSAEFPLPGRV
jgi:hypothetical protein